MTSRRVVYGLRYKGGEYLACHVSSNEGADFCGENSYSLSRIVADPTLAWHAATIEQAAYVRQFSTPWYNSSLETPEHSVWMGKDLEIVEIVLEVSVAPVTASAPTVDEFLDMKAALYPQDREFFESQKGSADFYSWPELQLVQLELRRKEGA